MHLLTVDRVKILIDCGLFQGRRDEFFAVNSEFPFEPSGIDNCIISHAHIDHCGNFPTLVRKGFRGKAYLTPQTRDLLRYMLPDSGHIQEEDIKYVNKINRRRGLLPRWPLYTQADAEKSLKFLRPIEYRKTIDIAKGTGLTLYDSGHILGASIPVIDIETNKGKIRIAYAVDLGRPNLPYLKNPEIPEDIDYIIIESTYGGKSHSAIETAEKKLEIAINKTVRRGGKVIIPAFALERSQEVLYFIARLFKHKKIEDIPVYVDSPLAVDITKVFMSHWDYFDEETRNTFQKELGPLSHHNINYISNVNQSKKLNDKKGPMIIISSSGMCENGRILHHLKNNIENPYNTIIVVGFMAKDTLGRKIVDKKPFVNIFGRPYQLNAEVVLDDAFSAHADREYLVKYIKECRKYGRLKKIFIVHGEPNQSDELRKSLKSLNLRVSVPEKNEVAFLNANQK
ncbi:MAG: MBL fold metallo-hydrolase [Candidatus Omnitrophota bacterium]